MGFFFGYKSKTNARKAALKSFKMAVIIEAEEVTVISDKIFYSWLLVQDVLTGNQFIEIMYIKQGQNGKWGYKFINELQGIQQVDCPLSFLDQANRGKNPEWRKQVHLYHKDIIAILLGEKRINE